MSLEQGGVEFDLMRHPEKKGEFKQTPEGEKIPLPVEGILQAQETAVEFANKVKDVPRAVVFGYTSNQARTAEADYIFSQELRYMAKKLPGSKVFDRTKDGSLEEIASKVEDTDDKVIIMGSPAAPVMGMREQWNMPYIEETLGAGMSDDEFLAKWMHDKEMQEKAGITPEQIGEEYKAWVYNQVVQAQDLFPGRPVIITALGHSWEVDPGIVALMGRKFDENTLAGIGGEQIRTMEGARVLVQPDGTGTVEYRGIKEELNLNSKKEG